MFENVFKVRRTGAYYTNEQIPADIDFYNNATFLNRCKILVRDASNKLKDISVLFNMQQGQIFAVSSL